MRIGPGTNRVPVGIRAVTYSCRPGNWLAAESDTFPLKTYQHD